MSDKDKIKQYVKDEILSVLNDAINTEVDAMYGHYTVGEIASEVLLNVRGGGYDI